MPCLIGFIATIASFGPPSSASPPQKAVASAPSSAPSAALPVELGFQELVIADPSGTLKPSAKALELEGKRVRVTGFMAELENPMPGGFYLCPLPIHGDESGGGIGDIPAHAIVVRLPYAKDYKVPHQKGRIIVTGTFHVGAPAAPDDFIGAFHIAAERPARPRVAAKPGGKRAKSTPKSVAPVVPVAPRGR